MLDKAPDKPLINVDWDGVVYPFVPVAMKRYGDAQNRSYGNVMAILDEASKTHSAEEMWRFWELFDIDRQHFWKWVDEQAELTRGKGNIYTSAHYIHDSVPALRSLAELYSLRIVTNKDHSSLGKKRSREAIIDYLNEHKVPVIDVVIANGPKRQYDFAEVVIDDSPNINSWRIPNAVNILFDAPWNYGVTLPNDVIRLHSWGQVKALLLSRELRNVRFEPSQKFEESKPTEQLEDAREQALEAIGLVYGARAESYGHPYDDFKRTAEAFNSLTGHSLTAHDAALMMLCVKLSREMNRHKRDNIVDAHGYLMVMERIREREGK